MSRALAIHGAGGRMGRAIADVVARGGQGQEPQEPEEGVTLVVTGAIEREGSPLVGQDFGVVTAAGESGVVITASLTDGLAGADVAIDFTGPASTRHFVAACADLGVPAVVGTTGLDAEALAALDAAAAKVPVVFAPNMSVGVNVLFHLAARAAALMGPEFDAEIVEMHHRHKVDAPSGTAQRLAEVVAAAKGIDLSRDAVHGRSGQVGARRDAEIGVMTLRGGDVVGEHTLFLAGAGERVELTHRATDRAIFARGAVRAARWAIGRDAGRYDMADVLGLAG
ncbi:MAG: 4-hydroxy-tetrahydrodipicolinate reductase [Deltaproteobacteria bacterium]|nr:4-hydroxy-tetrahydrodipicolinate reductase [Deltaproteobacteria bacterium]